LTVGVHIARGVDSLGTFNVMDNEICPNCKHAGQIVVYRTKPKMSDYVRDAPSLVMKKPGRRIGFTCGCYAKLHRQIVHIDYGKGTK